MKSLVPKSIAPPFAQYSHGIELPRGARMIRTSGQLGQAEDGSVPMGAHAQAQICFDNIQRILEAGGMTRHNVCHISGYVTDRVHMADYMTARDAFLADVAVLPTSTLLIVAGFTRPEFVVEVEVWAGAP